MHAVTLGLHYQLPLVKNIIVKIFFIDILHHYYYSAPELCSNLAMGVFKGLSLVLVLSVGTYIELQKLKKTQTSVSTLK